MTVREQADVLVLGAGFAGALMALVAQRLGLRVVLLEKGRHPRFAIGESSTPIDAEIIGNRIYVIEYSGSQGIWEISFPPAPAVLVLSAPTWVGNGSFTFTVNGAIPGQNCTVRRQTIFKKAVDALLLCDIYSTNSDDQSEILVARAHLAGGGWSPLPADC